MALVVPVFRARLGYITRLGWFIGSSGRMPVVTTAVMGRASNGMSALTAALGATLKATA